MSRYLGALLILAASVTALHAQEVVVSPEGKTCWASKPGESLGVCLDAQLRKDWCWAASAQMIMSFLARDRVSDFEQWKVATTEYGLSSTHKPCPSQNCFAGGGTHCKGRGYFPDFKKIDPDHAFRARSVDRALSWKELSDEIAAGRPVAFSWCWRDSGGCADEDSGHMLVAAGIGSLKTKDVNGNLVELNAVRVLQPLCCCKGDLGYFTYDQYREGKGHRHWRDFYCIRPTDTTCEELPKDDGPPFVSDVPAFSGAVAAAEAMRGEWLDDLGQAQGRGLLDVPVNKAFGDELPPAADPTTRTDLAEEIPIRVIRPSRIADWAEGATLESLFEKVERTQFPLRADHTSDTVPWLSTIEVQKGDDSQWRVAAVGGPQHARLLTEARPLAWARFGKGEFMEVRVLGLNVSFLVAKNPNDRLEVVPTCGACIGVANQPLPYTAFMAILKAAAKDFHGGGPT